MDSNRMLDFSEDLRYPITNGIKYPEFDTNHENQDKNYGNFNPYNKSIELPRNQSCVRFQRQQKLQKLIEARQEIRIIRQVHIRPTQMKYRNLVYRSSNKLGLIHNNNNGPVDMPDLSLFEFVNC